jgi:hypothetical protein
MIQKTYLKTKDYCKVKFSFTVENAETVEILGLNSDWENSIVMSKKKDGSFSAEVTLPKNSEHEFKYLVNATDWLNDTAADGEKANIFGGSNSVISLSEPAAAVEAPKPVKAAAKVKEVKAAKEVKKPAVKKAKK